MEVRQYIEALQDSGDRLGRAAVAAGPGAAVPTCTDWNVRDLLARQTVIVDEEHLTGGVANAGAVTRVGGHVLRPSNPHSESLHRFLSGLHAAGTGGPTTGAVSPPHSTDLQLVQSMGYVKTTAHIGPVLWGMWPVSVSARLSSILAEPVREDNCTFLVHADPAGHPFCLCVCDD